MLTFNSIANRYLRDQSIRFQVRAELDLGGGDRFFLSSGTETTPGDLDVVHIINSVTPIGPRLDPIKRNGATSNMVVSCVDDGYLRHLADTYPLKNGRLILTLAPAGIDVAAAVDYWSGLIHDIRAAGPYVEIVGRDALDYLKGAGYWGIWMAKHPLEFISDILASADVPSALIDSTSLDPATHTDISHLMASTLEGWGGDGVSSSNPPQQAGISTEYTNQTIADTDDPAGGNNARTAVEELAFMCGGTVIADELGAIRFKRFDPTEAVVATWTADDILDLKQESGFDALVNEVQIPLGNNEYQNSLYIVRDSSSQSRYAPDGISAWRRVHVLTSKYKLLGGVRVIFSDTITAGQTAGITFVDVANRGLAGTRVQDSFRELASGTVFDDVKPFTQDSDATLSSGRPIYVKFSTELLKATGLSFVADSYLQFVEHDEYGVAIQSGGGDALAFLPNHVTLSGVTRGAEATSDIEWNHDIWSSAAAAWDVTAAKLIAETILARAANGIPKLRIKTTMAQYAIQVGDLVSVVDSEPLWFGHDGFGADVKWEVISKQCDAMADVPGVSWVLAYATETTPPASTIEHTPVNRAYTLGQLFGVAGSHYAGTTTALTKNVFTVIDFNTVTLGEDYGWDGTNTYTAPETGVYNIEASVLIEGVPDGGSVQAAIFRNGSAIRNGPIMRNDSGLSADLVATVRAQSYVLTEDDAVDIRVNSSEAGLTSSTGEANTWISIQLVG